jgi:hypothetical protein
VIGPGCYQQPEPPLAPIRDGRAIPQPLSRKGAPGVTGGVETHLDNHVAAALDPLGRLVGTESFRADVAGYKALLGWLETFGVVTKVGIEGTGSYGVGLSRFLRRRGIAIVEVNRPNRQASDPLDAVEAARAALSGRATGSGKTKDGPVPNKASPKFAGPNDRPNCLRTPAQGHCSAPISLGCDALINRKSDMYIFGCSCTICT